MGRPKADREPASTIFKSSYDNRYHCYVDMGRPLPNGKPDRRHIGGFDYEEVKRKVLALEDLRDAGIVPPKGRQRCQAWFRYWLDNLAGVRAGYSTMEIRKWAVDLYLIPWLGHWWLDELETGHIDLMYATLHKEGLSAKSIGLIHETLMLILNKAISYKHIRGNPAAEATRPAVVMVEVEPLNTPDTIAFLAEAARRRNFIRWVFGILGARQGECLGARWPDLEDDEILNVRPKVQRRKYRHGCTDPHECARQHCVTKPCEGPWEHGCTDPKTCAARHCHRPSYPSDAQNRIKNNPCPPGCTGHARACPARRRGPCNKKRHKTCPPLCPEDCTGHAKACPQRIGGLKVIAPEQTASTDDLEPDAPRRKGSRRPTSRRRKAATKTEAGTRRFAIPEIFQPAIDAHRRQQATEQAAAGSKWEDHGLIVCTEFGRPIDRSRDWEEWCDILETCGIEHMPLHGLRHTAATILLALGVDRRIVMDILGWRDERMLARYQHVADELRRQAASLMSAILSGKVIAGSATTDATTVTDGELTTALVPLFSDIENAP